MLNNARHHGFTIAVVARLRPIFHPELAAFLKGLREARGLGQRQAANIAQSRGLTALTHGVLFNLENGKTKKPNPEALRALAVLYGIPHEDLLARFAEATYGPLQSTAGSKGLLPAE